MVITFATVSLGAQLPDARLAAGFIGWLPMNWLPLVPGFCRAAYGGRTWLERFYPVFLADGVIAGH